MIRLLLPPELVEVARIVGLLFLFAAWDESGAAFPFAMFTVAAILAVVRWWQ